MSDQEKLREFLDGAGKRREASATPEQLERRRIVQERAESLQNGIKRGSLAHPDGTFGKVKT